MGGRGRGRGRGGQGVGRGGANRQGDNGLEQGMRNANLNGNGRGGARGGFAGDSRPRREERVNADDIVRTKPEGSQTKKGNRGASDVMVPIITNFFRVSKRPDFVVMQFSLHFKADEDLYNQTGRKRYLLSQLKDRLPRYLFLGDSLFTTIRPQGLDTENKMVVMTHYDRDNKKVPVEITIKYVKDVHTTDIGYLQVLNQINAEHNFSMKLNQVGNSFFDVSAKVKYERHNLEIWPGFSSTIRQRENDLMMCLDLTNKVVRLDSALDTMRNCRGNQMEIKRALIGSIVVTHYNNDKTYRVDDVDFNASPLKTKFEHKTMGTINLIDYFKQQYNIRISDPHQPLLVSMPKKKDRRRTGSDQPIMLIPELCRMTGLTDSQRGNYPMMQDMASVLKMDPVKKLATTLLYAKKITDADAKSKVLTEWGIKVDPRAVEFQARRMKPESVLLGSRDGKPREFPYDPLQADWAQGLRNGMLTPVSLNNWVILYPARQRQDTQDFLQAFMKVCPGLKIQASRPREMEMRDDRGQTYKEKLQEIIRGGPVFIVIVLFRENPDLYRQIKMELLVRNPVPNQVITCQKVMKRNRKTGALNLSVVTKVAVQIGCKLGATPWKVQVPLANSMMVGFDTFHNKKGNRQSVGALAASFDANWSRYYSTISKHIEQNEMSDKMGTLLSEALECYKNHNNQQVPAKIFFYRDGVGEGQLQYIKETEVKKIINVLDTLPQECLPTLQDGTKVRPKLTYIVVSKRITPRFFRRNEDKNCEPEKKMLNPGPGTVIDDIVTLPERHDFYLVSQSVTQGTVNPTSYNVIHDENRFPAERNQALAYKLCHLYPNWPGTIRVPAPCQLAHKLAYLVGEHELEDPAGELRHLHYYL